MEDTIEGAYLSGLALAHKIMEFHQKYAPGDEAKNSQNHFWSGRPATGAAERTVVRREWQREVGRVLTQGGAGKGLRDLLDVIGGDLAQGRGGTGQLHMVPDVLSIQSRPGDKRLVFGALHPRPSLDCKP